MKCGQRRQLDPEDSNICGCYWSVRLESSPDFQLTRVATWCFAQNLIKVANGGHRLPELQVDFLVWPITNTALIRALSDRSTPRASVARFSRQRDIPVRRQRTRRGTQCRVSFRRIFSSSWCLRSASGCHSYWRLLLMLSFSMPGYSGPEISAVFGKTSRFARLVWFFAIYGAVWALRRSLYGEEAHDQS